MKKIAYSLALIAMLAFIGCSSKSMDFSHKHISAERIGDDAYKIAGRCFYSDSEHLYQIRIHFKGDERFNLKDWEYSVIDISNLDRTETEYHSIGSWDGDYN